MMPVPHMRHSITGHDYTLSPGQVWRFCQVCGGSGVVTDPHLFAPDDPTGPCRCCFGGYVPYPWSESGPALSRYSPAQNQVLAASPSWREAVKAFRSCWPAHPATDNGLRMRWYAVRGGGRG